MRGISMGISKIDIILIIVLAIVLLFVGGKKLPELARGVGQAAKELKNGFKDDDKSTEEKSEKSSKDTKK